MRKIFATIMAVFLVGAVMLYAGTVTVGHLTVNCGSNGGSARVSYPALSAGQSAHVEVRVYFSDHAPMYAEDTVYGPLSAGTVNVNCNPGSSYHAVQSDGAGDDPTGSWSATAYYP